MSSFESIRYVLKTAEDELTSFKEWLASVSFVDETTIVTEIKQRRHMACLLGGMLQLPSPDMIKFELALKGMFRTDLVLGNDRARKFALIEFEGAEKQSIFKRGTKQYRYWAPQIEHGFGQILDWAWVRNDHPDDSVLKNGFGGSIAVSSYAVICGRDASLRDDVERKRFKHRRDCLRVEGLTALVLTYDDMVREIDATLANAKSYV